MQISLTSVGKSRDPCSSIQEFSFLILSRFLSSTSSVQDSNEGWLSKLLVRRIEPTKESHSRLLSDKEIIYELQTHNVRADSSEKYLEN